MESDLLLDTEAVRRWAYELWRAAGSCEEEARLTADHLIGANLSGHDSHGLSVVPGYVRSLVSDQLQLNQRISIATDAGSLVVVDGNRGMGQSIAAQTMTLAIERAHRHGVAIVGLKNSHHIGRVGHWPSRRSRREWRRFTSVTLSAARWSRPTAERKRGSAPIR